MRPRGRRVHGEAVERPSFLLLFHSQISGGWDVAATQREPQRHPVAKVGTAPVYPRPAWPYCVASPALCRVAAHPGLVRCCFCGARLVYEAPQVGWTHVYHKGCSLGVSGCPGSILAPPLLCDTGQRLNFLEPQFSHM